MHNEIDCLYLHNTSNDNNSQGIQMNINQELAEKHAKYFHLRDEKVIREILHPEYTFEGPGGLILNSVQESIDFMMNMPMKAEAINSRFISEDDEIVHVFDLKQTIPTEVVAKVCEILTIKEGKILKIELFFDPTDFQ